MRFGSKLGRRGRAAAFRAVEALEDRLLFAAHIVGSPVVYSTIQSAVNAASTGATITVDAGSYAEQVTINKTLTLRGAQAGVDARLNTRRSGAGESVLTGATSSGVVSCALYVNANDVTIDGFTVQGETSQSTAAGAGIVIAPGRFGTHVYNNVIRNNVAGLFLANASGLDAAVIQYNVFQNNNNNGTDGGRGIYTDGGISGGNLTNVTIDSNVFYNNHGGSGTTGLEGSIALESRTANSQSNIRITNNAMDLNGKGVLAYNATGLLIQGNTVTERRDQWSGAVRFEGGMTSVTIQGNTIYANTGPGIRIDSKGYGVQNYNFTIINNNIYGNGIKTSHEGLVVIAGQYSGTLNAQNNWWGSATGPSGDGKGTGDEVLAYGNNVIYTPWSTAPNGSPESPYWGTAAVAGARIEAEDFDHGGEGIAFHDTDSVNTKGQYRPYLGVDIENTSDNGGYDVTAVAGEWLAYTVNVAQSGTYQFDFRVANGAAGGAFHLESDGVNVTGPISVPATGGAQVWKTISIAGIAVPAGQHVFRLVFDANSSSGIAANVNWFQFTNTGPSATPAAPSNLAAVAASGTQINLTWTNNATNQTGFKIDRSTDGVNFTTIATVASTSYSDASGLAAGLTYFYRVRATNAAGDSGNSNVASATTLTTSTVTTYLSDLPWVSATSGWGTVQRDLSVAGNPLTLNSVVYAKGLGAHAVSQIVYNVNGQYSTFISDVGVDDEENAKGIGSVDFQVIGDGKVLFDSGLVSNGLSPVHIAIDITGVKQLTLLASNGVPNSIDYDHADWAGARVLGTPVAPAAPGGLTASAVSTSQINLAWTNNTVGATAIKIYRSTDGVTFTAIATNVSPAATSYTDTGLAAGALYYYRIRATNSVGDSPDSNVASAATLSATATTTYLSDLPWVSATAGWGSVQKDTSVVGNPITLRGVVYAKGLGTHAVSQIVYNLNGQYSTFISDVGVDDEELSKGVGSVDFQVIGDGKVLFDSGVLTNSSPAVTIDVSVAGVQQLTLLATNGVPNSIDYDHADWAGARLFSNPVTAAAAAPTTAQPTNNLTTNGPSLSTTVLG